MHASTIRRLPGLAALVLLLASAGVAAQTEPEAGIYSVRTPVNVAASVLYSTVITPGDGVNAITVVTPPAHGGVVYPAVVDGSPSQAFVYTPAAGYTGVDDFIYRVQDGTGDVSFGTITINVGNVTATAADDDLVVSTLPGSFLDIFFNDIGFSDPVTFTITQQPSHGTLQIEAPGPPWQSLIGVFYTPTPGFTGDDQFSYRLSDGIDTDTAIVHLIVSPDPDGDEILSYFDNCPMVSNPNQEDADGDDVGNACDNCSAVANTGQQNNDADAQGDACDADDDNDSVLDTADNCVFTANPTQLNTDGDRFGNICDADLNNTNFVTSQDFNLMRSVINRASSYSALAAAADMNGSGLVTSQDFLLLRPRLNTVPGPSGLP
jgi:hypothetical protein